MTTTTTTTVDPAADLTTTGVVGGHPVRMQKKLEVDHRLRRGLSYEKEFFLQMVNDLENKSGLFNLTAGGDTAATAGLQVAAGPPCQAPEVPSDLVRPASDHLRKSPPDPASGLGSSGLDLRAPWAKASGSSSHLLSGTTSRSATARTSRARRSGVHQQSPSKRHGHPAGSRAPPTVANEPNAGMLSSLLEVIGTSSALKSSGSGPGVTSGGAAVPPGSRGRWSPALEARSGSGGSHHRPGSSLGSQASRSSSLTRGVPG